jgi:O-antigen ligase
VQLNDFSKEWKYGAGLAITGGLLLVFGKKLISTILILILSSAFSLYVDSRFLFACGLLTSIYLLFFYKKEKLEHSVLRRKKFTPIFVLFVFSAPIIFFAYSSLALGGYLGQVSQDKFIEQSQNSSALLLISARREVFYTTEKIKQSPLIGGGSYVRIDEKTLLDSVRLQNSVGLSVRSSGEISAGETLLPSHSYLFGSWVEAGILGAVFWIYVLFFIFAFFNSSYNYESNAELSGFVTYLSFFILWEILFSPFGQEKRIYVGLLVGIIMQLKSIQPEMEKNLE